MTQSIQFSENALGKIVRCYRSYFIKSRVTACNVLNESFDIMFVYLGIVNKTKKAKLRHPNCVPPTMYLNV